MLIPAIVLAAGASTRMGRPKALLRLHEDTFLALVARALREGGADDVLVVTGADHEAIAEEAGRLAVPPRVVHNAACAEGQLSSLRAGLMVADRPGVGGVIVALVDHPRVRPDTVARLLDAFRTGSASLVRPRFGGRHGHPVVFGRQLFEPLMRVPLHEGARAVVHMAGVDAASIDVDDPGVREDVDTPEDFARLPRP